MYAVACAMTIEPQAEEELKFRNEKIWIMREESE